VTRSIKFVTTYPASPAYWLGQRIAPSEAVLVDDSPPASAAAIAYLPRFVGLFVDEAAVETLEVSVFGGGPAAAAADALLYPLCTVAGNGFQDLQSGRDAGGVEGEVQQG
jgi:hypothetical protein